MAPRDDNSGPAHLGLIGIWVEGSAPLVTMTTMRGGCWCRTFEPMESTSNMRASDARAIRSSCSSWDSRANSSSGRNLWRGLAAKGVPGRQVRQSRRRQVDPSDGSAGARPTRLLAEVWPDDGRSSLYARRHGRRRSRTHGRAWRLPRPCRRRLDGRHDRPVDAINHADRTKSLISIMSTTGRRDLPSGNRRRSRRCFARPRHEP